MHIIIIVLCLVDKAKRKEVICHPTPTHTPPTLTLTQTLTVTPTLIPTPTLTLTPTLTQTRATLGSRSDLSPPRPSSHVPSPKSWQYPLQTQPPRWGRFWRWPPRGTSTLRGLRPTQPHQGRLRWAWSNQHDPTPSRSVLP